MARAPSGIEDMDPRHRDVPTWTAAEFIARVGTEIGVSSWHEMTQERVDQFAICTEDVNYIHVNPPRAAAEPGFDGTIAHGFLTLSLLSNFSYEVTPMVAGAVMGLNYGLDKVRFVSPVPVGSRVRGRLTLASSEVKNGALVNAMDVVVEIEGREVASGGRPALVARWLGHAHLSEEALAAHAREGAA